MPKADAAKIRLIILDVDGCLTDGSVYLDGEGRETKRFNIKDGLGIAVWMKLGFHIAVITGRKSDSLIARCEELGITELHQGVKDKGAKFFEVIEAVGCEAHEAAAFGDDWNDLPVLKRVGIAMCPVDASGQIRELADFVSVRPGGHGAVREGIEMILSAKGLMERALEFYDI